MEWMCGVWTVLQSRHVHQRRSDTDESLVKSVAALGTGPGYRLEYEPVPTEAAIASSTGRLVKRPSVNRGLYELHLRADHFVLAQETARWDEARIHPVVGDNFPSYYRDLCSILGTEITASEY